MISGILAIVVMAAAFGIIIAEHLNPTTRRERSARAR